VEYNKRLFDSLQSISKKYHELNIQLETASLPIAQLTEINKQLKRQKPVVDRFFIYEKMIDDANQAEKILNSSNDKDLLEMAKVELEEIKIKLPTLENELKVLLLPVDPNDEKNVIIEMRPAAGGDESSIFVADLFDTYQRFADKMK
jgi:peptide chain release factor 1